MLQMPMKDNIGQKLHVGDFIVYAVRKSSSIDQYVAIIDSIARDRVRVIPAREVYERGKIIYKTCKPVYLTPWAIGTMKANLPHAIKITPTPAMKVAFVNIELSCGIVITQRMLDDNYI